MTGGCDYDLVVIGAGIAGMVSAVTANGIGKKVAVIEKRWVGGNCTNLTCIPSKSLIRVGHVGSEISRLGDFGLALAPTPGLDTKNVMPHIRAIVKRAYEKDLPETFQSIGVDIISGSASFVDNHKIKVANESITADKFIIACGTTPMIPNIPGLEDVDFLTSENIYELNELPRSMIILGGGVDGLEYASAFGRLGVEVTIVERSKQPLAMADREPVNHLLSALEEDGIRILIGATASRIYNDKDQVSAVIQRDGHNDEEISAERILVTLGRKPDFDGLDLDNAGVEYSFKGIVTDRTLRTTASNIYACGDVAGPYQLANTAEYQAILAATNLYSPIKQKTDYSNNVYVIFTDPTYAFIGLTEAEAHAKYGSKLNIYRFKYENMRRAMVDCSEVGMAKFLCDGAGRLVGAHILGEAAAEVIHEAQLIKALKKPLHKLNFITHAYPTYAQALVGRAIQLAFLERMEKSLLVRFGLFVMPGFSNKLSLARERLAETHDEDSAKKTARVELAIMDPTTGREDQRVTVERTGDITCVINAPLEITGIDEGPVLAACSGGVSGKTKRILLNFEHVKKINGVGATMLVKLCVKAKKNKQTITAIGVSQSVREILKVTQLDQIISIEEPGGNAKESQEEMKETPGSGPVPVNIGKWAKPVEYLEVGAAPEVARNLNVNGRRPIGPVNGFGQLIQKVYTLTIKDTNISPEDCMLELKNNFAAFQPSFNKFYPLGAGIEPGEITLIESMTPGGPVATGVMILYSDDLSFTFMTPEGHPEAGFVSFSAFRNDIGTITQIAGLTRANDPLFELAFHTLGSKIQKGIWIHVLTSLALHYGAPADITYQEECVDRSMQWRQITNIKNNAQIHTLIHEPARIFRSIKKRLKRNQ